MLTGCEVALQYEVKIGEITNKPTNLNFYTDNTYSTLLTKEAGSEEYKITGVMTTTEIATTPTKDIQIHWKWDYETENGDEADTTAGANAAKAGDTVNNPTMEGKDVMTFTVSITGTQYMGEITYTAYSIGDEVKVGTEEFYVLEESDATKSTVTLLAKKNINTTTTPLVQSASANEVAFANTNYWALGWVSGERINLNEYTIPATITVNTSNNNYYDANGTSLNVEAYALTAARNYGTQIGGTGRLLTRDEVIALRNDYGDMIYGPSSARVNYWLGSSCLSKDYYVYCVAYADLDLLQRRCHCGVRPVITISKSLLS